jgi:hypothetical protein
MIEIHVDEGTNVTIAVEFIHRVDRSGEGRRQNGPASRSIERVAALTRCALGAGKIAIFGIKECGITRKVSPWSGRAVTDNSTPLDLSVAAFWVVNDEVVRSKD